MAPPASYQRPQNAWKQYNGALQTPLSGDDIKAGLVGLFAWLPKEADIPWGSVIRQQLSSGGFGHPCVVTGTSKCGRYVECRQVTSFGGRSIQTKYGGKAHHPAYDNYLAIKDARATHGAPNNTGLLETTERMPKPSYINLNQSFWIEVSVLHRWYQSQIRLMPAALRLLQAQFRLACPGKGRRMHPE
jgi:hypothetical protein